MINNKKLNMDTSVKGTCENLCPEKEKKMRIKGKILDFYELNLGRKEVPGILVKSFSRSAAGVKKPKASELRTERALEKTIEYLLEEILPDNRKPYFITYEFIFDRMRAVRQEVVMQDFNEEQTIKFLEPMIMFLAYSRYRLCEEPISSFDPKICEQHLQECLKRVLVCYDELPLEDFSLQMNLNRLYIEAIYQLFNLGSVDALWRAVLLPKFIRFHSTFELTYKIALSFYQGNLYRVVKYLDQLPHILSAMAALHLVRIRHKMFHAFTHSYNSKQGTVPADFLYRVMAYSNMQDLFKDCKYYNLSVVGENDKRAVQFQKANFKNDLPPQPVKQQKFVNKKLDVDNLSEILMLKWLQ